MPQAQRKQRSAPMPLSFQQDESEQLTAEEQAALEAEAGAAAEVPTEAETPIPVPPQEAATTEQAPAEQPPEQAATEGKETPAQKRIQGLIDERRRKDEQITKLNEQLAAQQQAWARLDERKKQMEELQAQAQRQAEAAREAAQRPDPDVDPQGARIWDLQQQLAQLAEAQRQRDAQFQQFGQQTQQQMAQRDVDMYLTTDYARVRAQKPDLDNAIEHLHQVRVRLNKALGYGDEPIIQNGQVVRPSAEQLWNMERQAYVAQARQNGVSINEFAYEMAKTAGYQGAAPAANGNGGVQPTVQPQVMPSGKERVAQLTQAQKMQGLGGKVAAAESDQYANIRSMPAAQFAVWLDQNLPDGEDLLALANDNPTLYKVIEKRMAELG